MALSTKTSSSRNDLSTLNVDKPIFIKKQYRPHPRVVSKIDPASGLTHQSFKEEADINNLVQNWLRTGIAQFTLRQPQFVDVSSVPEAHAARNLITLAEQEFALLSDDDKKKYGHPMAYLESLVEATEAVGTENPLGVTVPTDTNSLEPSQKGGNNETDEDQKNKK